MNAGLFLKSPVYLVSFSFVVGVFNFLDTFVRLMFSFMVPETSYPLGVYLKPIFILAQATFLIAFIRTVRFVQKPIVSGPMLSRFFAAHMVLAVVVFLLYVDFLVLAVVNMYTVNAFLQLVFNLVYVFSLSGTSFWFALKLLRKDKWQSWSIVFILIGLVFMLSFLESMFFWSQNYLGLAFPSQLAIIATYTPPTLMFFAAMFTIVFLLMRTPTENSSLLIKLASVLFVPAFLLPLFWDSYKEGLVNQIIRDVFYWSFGYSGSQWYSVSFYLMAILAYFLAWKELSKRSDHSVAYSLIVWGVASFPWNGIVLLKAGYSSILGNVISLCSIITGASLLETRSVTM